MTTPPDQPPASPAPSPLVWDDQGLPRSRLFDDVYFSSFDGLEESRAVFLQGCGLPQAWSGRSRFVVGELGFGSGLNIVALLDLWRRTRPPEARLQIFSIEAYPLLAADAARVLGHWPELAETAAPLLARWPGAARGFHRIDLAQLGATLDLAVMDVAEALAGWRGTADAWFLDGFSPAANPAMWSPEVMAALAARTAPGGRIGTFTVAGAVRRGLAAAGFSVDKRPGFGRKRERLEAIWPGLAPESAGDPAPDAAPAPRVAIIGGGIAGAALARAFRAQGLTPTVIEAEAPGAGGSGNPAGLVMPRLDAGGGDVARLYAQAFRRAVDLYDQSEAAVIARGALQAETGPKDPDRFDRIAASDLFEPGAVVRLSPQALGVRLGEPLAVGGLAFRDALVVEPAAILSAWFAQARLITAQVARLDREAGVWRLWNREGELICAADLVCLAAGLAAARFATDAPLSPVRGQVSFSPGAAAPQAAIGGGYLIPTRDGLLFGATHDRGETAIDVRPGDHARNLDLLAQLRPDLATDLTTANLEGRAGVRAATPDFLPLAGEVTDQPGLFILAGLGSRGFCAAPLLAEHVAALCLGAPSPLPEPLIAIIEPQRFEKRRMRTGRPRSWVAPVIEG